MGIRGRLLLLVQGVLALSLAGAAVFGLELHRREELIDFQLRNEKVLHAVGVTAAVHVAQNDIAGLDTLIAHLTESLQSRDLISLAVVNAEGRVLAHSETERFNTELDDPLVKEAIASQKSFWVRSQTELFVGVPAVSGIRWATVVARFSLARLDAQMATVRMGVWLGVLGLFLVLGSATFVGLDRIVVRPIYTLQQGVRRIAEGALSTRVPPLKSAELAELSATVNRMAQALQAERDNLERAVAERTRELQDANARLERLAVTDGLTGLFNHRRFQETLQAELLRTQRHRRPLSVLMVDVDYFKRVNDSLGHPVGDELLRRLAEVLGNDLRQTDLIARYGGEEFAAVLPETTKTEALQVAERMRAAVEQKINEERTWGQKVTVSIGVATAPEDGDNHETVLEAADQALYVAKRQGRNRVIGVRGALA